MRAMKKLIGACAAVALFGVGCGDGAEVQQCASARTGAKVMITCPDGTSVELQDGRDGTNGQNGGTGEDGTDGADGTSCTATVQSDGTKLITCTDGTSFTVTDGAQGEEGKVSMVALAEEPEGAHCAFGGTAVNAGVDANGSGVLDTDEITSTQYICNASPFEVNTTFTGFDGIAEDIRSEVTFNTRIYGVFDPATVVRWKATLTDENDQPVSGVQSFYWSPEDGDVPHTQWGKSVESDAQGESWFGPPNGFTAAEAGLTEVGGVTTAFSVLAPTAGPRTLKLELIRVSDGSVISKSSVSFVIAEVIP